jgi:hypothetical protein
MKEVGHDPRLHHLGEFEVMIPRNARVLRRLAFEVVEVRGRELGRAFWLPTL